MYEKNKLKRINCKQKKSESTNSKIVHGSLLWERFVSFNPEWKRHRSCMNSDVCLLSQSSSSERSRQSTCPSHLRRISMQLPSSHCTSYSEHVRGSIGPSVTASVLWSANFAEILVQKGVNYKRKRFCVYSVNSCNVIVIHYNNSDL